MGQKVFKTFNQQLIILRNRGLDVPKNGKPKRDLESENYYNIINGYKDLFLATRRTQTSDEVYKSGAKFSEIKALYEFDFELKSIILKRILRVENMIKTTLAYNFSQKYGHDNYMKIDNFNHGNNPRNMANVMDLIQGVQGIIARQVNKHGAIKHYMLEHGYVPLWVLVNILPLGTISKFYNCMKQQDKQSIARFYNLNDTELVNILKTLTYCRNKCAHGERLYNFKSSAELRENGIHQMLNIPKSNGKLIYGINDLLSVLITLKLFLRKKDFNKMMNEIKYELSILEKELNVITINDVYEKMGFVWNWYDMKE